MSKTNTGLLEYARAQLGRPYWYGTYGQIATEKLYKEKKAQYPSRYEKWTKESFLSQVGQKVHDCAGLVKGYMMSEGINTPAVYNSKYDVSANGMIALCQTQGAIGSIPELPGLIVWKDGHVGIYEGNGIVIEAKGHSYGVVRSKIGATAWKKWGQLPSTWITYESEDDTCMVELPVLRKGDKGQAVKSMQACLDVYGYGLAIDGSFGGKSDKALRDFQSKKKLTVDGVCGQKTWSALLT